MKIGNYAPSADLSAIPPDQGSLKLKEMAKQKDAAKQFEALMLTQLLRASHDEDSGWLGGDEEEGASSCAMGLGEECFAQALAQRGGLGLARMVEAGLEKK
jgi:Rod binding domain-containing protein